jgi:hypothetical protein
MHVCMHVCMHVYGFEYISRRSSQSLEYKKEEEINQHTWKRTEGTTTTYLRICTMSKYIIVVSLR